MKYLSSTVALVFFGLTAPAGEFINLNFEQANLTGSQLEYRTLPSFPGALFPFGSGPTAQLLPGWNVFYGQSLLDGTIRYDPVSTVSIGNGFIDPPSPESSHVGLIIPGDYVNLGGPYDRFALVFNDLARMSGGGPAALRVSQVGTVPLDAQLLKFRLPESGAVWLFADENFYQVRDLPRDPSDQRGYMFDISPWAGKEIELGFQTSGGLYYVVDDISFAIPEPSTVSLLLLGGAALGFTIWKRTRRF
jgi:hypothetical protein